MLVALLLLLYILRVAEKCTPAQRTPALLAADMQLAYIGSANQEFHDCLEDLERRELLLSMPGEWVECPQVSRHTLCPAGHCDLSARVT